MKTIANQNKSTVIMKSLVAALISVTGEYGVECANSAIIAESQMKTIFIYLIQ